ncbi:hypothetical protein [Ideonella sp. YS5]|uniref:hypothetical protein n=1 Tax=Ideonella sp. YS5 TaxID=3453714 RepID=UPI003EEED999
MTSPVHSQRISTPVKPDAEKAVEITASPPRAEQSLARPPGLSGRGHAGASTSGSQSQRVRQPVPETSGPSPEHAGSSLLRTGERSDRFSTLERGRYLSSGRLGLDSTPQSSHGSSRFDGIVSESSSINRWVPHTLEQPRAQRSTTEPNPSTELQAPEPKRSWLSVAKALTNSLKQMGNAVLNEASVTLSIVKLPKIPKRLMGALAGHAIHQTVAVGIPTFVREMVGIGVMHAMRAQPASVAVGVQVTVGVANLALQGLREFRELRNPAEAARAYFSLSASEWAAKSPEEQAAMKLHHRRMSRAMTVVQVSASVTNVALMVHNFALLDPVRNRGFAGHDHTNALRPLANEVKVGVYAAMRDGIQATFTMVGFTASPTAEPGNEFAAGLRGAAHGAAAATYAAANSASSFLSDALMGAWVPHRGDAISTLMGNTATKMSHAQAWKDVALGAGVSAMANTLAETIDWFQRMEHFVNQTGATQHFEFGVTGTDYGRLLDQAPARAAAFNGIFSALTLAGGEMAKSDLPPAVQQFIGNVGLGVMISMLDSPVSGLWQAEDAVRTATRTTSSVQIEEIPDPEAGVGDGAGADRSGRTSGEISGGSGSDGSGATRLSAGNPPERRRSPSPTAD